MIYIQNRSVWLNQQKRIIQASIIMAQKKTGRTPITECDQPTLTLLHELMHNINRHKPIHLNSVLNVAALLPVLDGHYLFDTLSKTHQEKELLIAIDSLNTNLRNVVIQRVNYFSRIASLADVFSKGYVKPLHQAMSQ